MSHEIIRSVGTPEQYAAKAREVLDSWKALAPETLAEWHSEEHSRPSRELAGMDVPGWDWDDHERCLLANGMTTDMVPADESVIEAARLKYGWTR